MEDEELDQLLLAHLNGTRASLVDERSAYLMLPIEKQEIVRKRLKILDRYLKIIPPTYADAELSAKRMNVSIRTFYRLLASLRQNGPVAALAPNARRTLRVDAVARALPEQAERALNQIVKESPGATWAQIVAYVRGKSEPAPSEAAIRRRLLALRRELALCPDKDASFGQNILVDRVALDIAVTRADGESEYSTATVILDVQTKLVLGIGLKPISWIHPSSELQGAIFDYRDRCSTFEKFDLRVIPVPLGVRWIVPDDLLDLDAVENRMIYDQPPELRGFLEAVHIGKFRFAVETVNLIGEKLDDLRILVRATADSMLKRTDRAPVTPDEARVIILRAATRWNAAILENFNPAINNDTSRHSLQRLGRCLVELFADCFPGSTALTLMSQFSDSKG